MLKRSRSAGNCNQSGMAGYYLFNYLYIGKRAYMPDASDSAFRSQRQGYHAR